MTIEATVVERPSNTGIDGASLLWKPKEICRIVSESDSGRSKEAVLVQYSSGRRRVFLTGGNSNILDTNAATSTVTRQASMWLGGDGGVGDTDWSEALGESGTDGETEHLTGHHLMCWTQFRDTKQTSLCVLSAPNEIMVFEDGDQTSFLGGGDGQSIHLPCQARAIFAIDGGLLVQRRTTPDDADDDDNGVGVDYNDAGNDFGYSDDRMDRVGGTELASRSSSATVSLFSISHPLDPVLPVAGGGGIRDRVVSVVNMNGTGQDDNDNKDNNNNTRAVRPCCLCTTYHDKLKRHAVWEFTTADLAPIAPLPLWQMHRTVSGPDSSFVDTGLLVDNGDEPSPYLPHTSRHEALAEALGVQRPPTNTIIATAPTSPLLALHPKFRMRLLYESVPRQEQASSVFPQNNLLHVQVGASLLLWKVNDERQILPVASIPCRAAVPIGRKAVLVLNPKSRLGLYVDGKFVVEVTIPNKATVLDMAYPVGDTVEVCTAEYEWLRCKVSLGFPSDPFTERILSIVDSAVHNDSEGLSFAVRVDSVKIAQGRSVYAGTDPTAQTSIGTPSLSSCDNGPWLAVCNAILAIFVDDPPEPQPAQTASAWEVLLASDFHNDYNADFLHEYQPSSKEHGTIQSDGRNRHTGVNQCQFVRRVLMGANDRQRQQWRASVFDALHGMYEDCKLSLSKACWMKPLARLLTDICSLTSGMEDYTDHYIRDGTTVLSSAQSSLGGSSSTPLSSARFSAFSDPPNVMEWLWCRIKGMPQKDPNSYWDSNQRLARTTLVCRLFTAMFPIREDGSQSALSDIRSSSAMHCRVMETLLDGGIDRIERIERDFPTAIALPILDAVRQCRGQPALLRNISEQHKASAWGLVGREDIQRHETTVTNITSDRSRYHDGPSQSTGQTGPTKNGKDNDDNDKDGLVPLEKSSAILYPADNRLREVGRLLRSSRPIFLKVPRAVEVTDHDFERLKQERLLELAGRALALPLGRGMVTFGGLNPLPAERLPVPKLCLTGRVPPTNNPLALDATSLSDELKVWPEFHNGAAAGLRLDHAGSVHGGDGLKITRSWIVYNRATQSSAPGTEQGTDNNNNQQQQQPESERKTGPSHGGLLMALGLRGHLSALSMTDVFQYLTEGSVTTSVGILLGMAASKLGTCDPAVSKMLCLHIPSLLPPSFSSVDVSGPVRSAAVVGIGLLYRGSSHRLMTEFLLSELGRKPMHDSCTVDRESYSLSCGLALGMLNLAKNDSKHGTSGGSAGLADLDMDRRLHRYIVGGEEPAKARHFDLSSDRFAQSNADGEWNARIHEGQRVNNDVTAPGAILALGLMYLKSGNASVASLLELPQTHFLLEFVRPDFMMLRVIARSMVLWDTVQASGRWIQEQIPAVVRQSFREMFCLAEDRAGLGGTRRGKDKNRKVDDPLLFGEDNGEMDLENTNSPHTEPGIGRDVDKQAVRQMYCYTIAGACFAIGLRFAGTADKDAAATIQDRILLLHSFREGDNLVYLALRPDPTIVELCLGLCAISLGIVMAGSGDLDSLRLLKLIRWRCEDDTKYGTHMSIGAAIGLLFLGGGMSTLGRSNQDVAALVMAFFPRFPATASENSFHLQALRHFYALAVKRRDIRAINVDTSEQVCVQAELDLGAGHSKKVQTPCLVTNTDHSLRGLKIDSNRYYSRNIRLDRAQDKKTAEGYTVWVKEKTEKESDSSPTVDLSRIEPRKSGSATAATREQKAQDSFVVPENVWQVRLLRAYLESGRQNSAIATAIAQAEQKVVLDKTIQHDGSNNNNNLEDDHDKLARLLSWFSEPRE